MAVARPASAGPEARRSPAADRRALSADAEPRTLAARKAYPEPASPLPSPKQEDEVPLDLTVRKEITVCDFARHPFVDPADYVRAQVMLRQSRDYLATGRDSGTESDDSAGRLSPGEDAVSGKAYKKSLMKRYSKFYVCFSSCHCHCQQLLFYKASFICAKVKSLYKCSIATRYGVAATSPWLRAGPVALHRAVSPLT